MSVITSTEKKRRFFLFVFGSFIAVISILLLSFYFFAPSKQVPKSSLSVAKTDSIKGRAGGQGTEEYNKKLEAHDAREADAALLAGESHVPTPIGKPALVTRKEPDTPPPAPTVVAPRVVPARSANVDNSMMKQMMEDLAQLDARLSAASEGSGQIAYLCASEKENKKEQAGASSTLQREPTDAATPQTDLKPGDLLYAVVDTGVNSDVPSAVMATVVQGKYNKTRLIGKFQRFDERIVLAFSRAIPPSGETVQLEAYAIDPDTTEASVASSVDTHFFSRWGGLIASAFLEGLGTAKKFSGAQSTMYGGYDGTADQMVWNNYSLEDQAWIAAGKVGEKAGKIFEKNFERPPTVYLASGSPIGILIMNVKDGPQGQKSNVRN